MDQNSYLIQLANSDRVAFGKIAFVDQSQEQKVFSAIWALESQVNNGGFSQYFYSSDGETAEFAPTALRRVGARACAALVERALAALPVRPLPASQVERAELVDGLGSDELETLEAIDAEFFAYPDDLTALLFEFVSTHPDAFGQFPPLPEG